MQLLKLLTATVALAGSTLAAQKPNIVFIFCDDLGYGDLGVFYQNERAKSGKPSMANPHLDKLAAEGMQLHAHYAPAPVCAPSRASLFLGMSQGNAPIRNNQFDKELPDQPTLASVLQHAGYSTALIGKWGLQGKGGKSAETWPSYPTKRGFDYYLGGVRHVDGHEHYPYDLVHFHKRKQPVEIWEQNQEISSNLKGCYSTDLFTAATKKWLVDHKKASPEKPFFLFLSYDTPHAATQIATSPYPDGFGLKGGIQWIGKKDQWINTATTGKADSYIHPDYAERTHDHDNDASTPEVPWQDVYKRFASSVRRIDNSVADILQTLKDLDLDDNTLIVFTSDHGPSQESYIKQALNPSFFASFGPFSGIKRDCWEGGIRPGALVRWPAAVKAGSSTDTPSQMDDWMATFCDLAGIPTPALSDGVSLAPTLTGKGTQEDKTIYVEYSVGGATPKYPAFPKNLRGKPRGQMQAVRLGDLKAIRTNTKKADTPFMVFDVVKDPREANNLAGSEGIPSQDYWQAVTARLHSTNPTAKRPYDGILIPALTGIEVKDGVVIRQAKSSAPFAIRVETSDNTTSSDLTVAKTDLHTSISGYLKVEKNGKHQFKLAEGCSGVLRIHQLLVVDTDASTLPVSTLNLEAGLHPFTLHLKPGSKVNKDFIEWTLPGQKKPSKVTAAQLGH